MKKLLLIVAGVVAFACSNDDAPDTVQVTKYFLNILDECPGGTVTVYEVNLETYNSAKDLLDEGGTCRNINFFDVEGESHLGYLSGVSQAITSN